MIQKDGDWQPTWSDMEIQESKRNLIRLQYFLSSNVHDYLNIRVRINVLLEFPVHIMLAFSTMVNSKNTECEIYNFDTYVVQESIHSLLMLGISDAYTTSTTA